MIIWVNSESARPVYGFYKAVISIKEIHIQFILQELLSGELIFLLQFIVCVGEKCGPVAGRLVIIPTYPAYN